METFVIINQIIIMVMLGVGLFFLIKRQKPSQEVKPKSKLQICYDTLNQAIMRNQKKFLLDGETLTFFEFYQINKGLSHYGIPFDYDDKKDLFLIHLDRYSGAPVMLKIFEVEPEYIKDNSPKVKQFTADSLPPKLISDIFEGNVIPFKKKQEFAKPNLDFEVKENVIYIDFESRKRKA